MGEIGTDENFGDRPREHCIYNKHTSINPSKGPGWFNELGSWITEQLIQAYYQYGVGSRPALQITKKGALDSQPKVIKFTSCLPMVGGYLRLLQSLNCLP